MMIMETDVSDMFIMILFQEDAGGSAEKWNGHQRLVRKL